MRLSSGQREDGCGREPQVQVSRAGPAALCWAREELGCPHLCVGEGGLNLSERLGGVPIYWWDRQSGARLSSGFSVQKGYKLSVFCGLFWVCLPGVGRPGIIEGESCRVPSTGRAVTSNHSGDPPNLTVCRPVRPCSPWRHSKEELQGIDLRGTSVGTPASEHPTGEAQGTQGPRHLAVALPAEVGFWPMWVCEG